MKNNLANPTLIKIAKIAGFSYLIIFVSGIFANFVVLESLVVQGNAELTANNIMESESLYLFGIFAFLIMVIFDVIVTWALYLLLKPVNKTLSLFSAWFRLVNSTIFGVALFNLVAVLRIIRSEQLGPFEMGQMMLLFDSFDITWLLGLVFFAIHLIALGYLVLKSDYIPKFLGILLLVAAVGYLVDSSAQFILSNYDDYEEIFSLAVIVPGVIGEFAFTLWLLIRGFRKPAISKT